MQQQTLAAQVSFEKYRRKTRRELFLYQMERVVPWAQLQAAAEPHYLKAVKLPPLARPMENLLTLR